ncbi:apses-domain-containing protein [Rhizopus microsporus var. microsporus]|uniref:Apses-domain-containing protein n=2 Tax=Rhizopus microsporus TaxID=58291 RepID=A0A2G4T5P8_RHIZD|nr:apses-domain-containing protein [Rhizopus microsporus ATCC 52813]ORE09029.1 apses-domain-containing protein [Rhizopus microsporus var. microsporus]PHZ16344.1 apses-domain-containing protein [Rhizopus microsporus ATCC 52813]
MYTSRIYSAAYSGVPVFEMIVNSVAVMRRRNDSYMNATQILKVANIDKGRRTKILEREVLSGQHEKIQGGYGKYQGTWIPFEKSKELAERYNVYELLKPLFEFDVNSTLIVDNQDTLPTKEQAIVALRKQNAENISNLQQSSLNNSLPKLETSSNTQAVENEKPKHTPSHTQPASRFPSEHQHLPHIRPQLHTLPSRDEEGSPARKKPKANTDTMSSLPNPAELRNTTEEMATQKEDTAIDERSRSILMSIFLTDNPEHVLDILQNSASPSNIDMVIDESGNTALHWAAALARVKTVEQLIARGANISCANYSGETPLMRSVLVTNNFENRTFSEILELLKGSITTVDNKRRSALHHACLTSGISGRSNAAIYYVDYLLKTITSKEEHKSVINMQDSLGDTATTIAARLNSHEILELLMKAGATKITENNVGLASEDYEDGGSPALQSQQAETQDYKAGPSDMFSFSKKTHGPSQRGKEIVATVQKIVDALDEEYGAQLVSKEQQLNSIQNELDDVMKELDSTRKELEERQVQSQKLSEAQQKTHNIETALENGWARLEETMEKAGKQMPNRNEIDTFDENEDIDSLFNVNIDISDDATEEEQKNKMQERVRRLRAVVEAYRINDGSLKKEIEEIQTHFMEKEMQCKRLIAACCNLPIEKIDDLVEPLTLAIESDPPDLDLARVIGFMDKVKRQGAFTEVPISSSTSSFRQPSQGSPLPLSNADTNSDTDHTMPSTS